MQQVRRLGPVVVVLFVAAVGVVLFALAHWRRGSAMFGLAALIGAGLRLIVSEKNIGVLAVRGKVFDVTFMLALAGLFALLVFWPE